MRSSSIPFWKRELPISSRPIDQFKKWFATDVLKFYHVVRVSNLTVWNIINFLSESF